MSGAQVLKIARREYLARVRSRAFIVMTVAIPALLGFYMFSIPLLTRTRNVEQRFAILDAGTGLADPVTERVRAIERPRITIDQVVQVGARNGDVRQRFDAALQARTIDGYLLVDRGPSGDAHISYFTREAGNPALIQDLRLAFQAALLSRLLTGTGVDANQVRHVQEVAVDVVTVSDQGERRGGIRVALGVTMALAMLLYVAVLINGQGMAMAIVEEKSSRLVEVILGAVTATEFMTGKILGLLGSGVTQLAVWLAVAIVALLQAAPAITLAPGALDLTAVLSARLLVYFAIFFTLGYALYSMFFAIVAVTCTSTEEIAQSMLAASLPMVLAIVLTINVVSNPASPATRILSLVPFFTPLVMMARVNVLMPPVWEVWLSILLLVAAIVLVAWAAAKIFRYALLMTGKRPTLPELMAVVRAQ